MVVVDADFTSVIAGVTEGELSDVGGEELAVEEDEGNGESRRSELQ